MQHLLSKILCYEFEDFKLCLLLPNAHQTVACLFLFLSKKCQENEALENFFTSIENKKHLCHSNVNKKKFFDTAITFFILLITHF